MNDALRSAIDRWTFMTLGVFTTCCYTKDFAALDLLRFPQTHTGSVSGNVVTFELPNWFPHEQAIFATSDGSLFSKLRDLPLARQTKPAPNNNKYLGIQLPSQPIGQIAVTLTYSPLFRFAHTGKQFSIDGSIGRFVCRIFEYAARRAGMSVSVIESTAEHNTMNIDGDSGPITVLARGSSDLKSISILTNQGGITLDLESQYLQIATTLTPALTEAIQTMTAAGNLLQNCEIRPSAQDTIELRYRG